MKNPKHLAIEAMLRLAGNLERGEPHDDTSGSHLGEKIGLTRYYFGYYLASLYYMQKSGCFKDPVLRTSTCSTPLAASILWRSRKRA